MLKSTSVSKAQNCCVLQELLLRSLGAKSQEKLNRVTSSVRRLETYSGFFIALAFFLFILFSKTESSGKRHHEDIKGNKQSSPRPQENK